MSLCVHMLVYVHTSICMLHPPSMDLYTVSVAFVGFPSSTWMGSYIFFYTHISKLAAIWQDKKPTRQCQNRYTVMMSAKRLGDTQRHAMAAFNCRMFRRATIQTMSSLMSSVPAPKGPATCCKPKTLKETPPFHSQDSKTAIPGQELLKRCEASPSPPTSEAMPRDPKWR